MQQRQHLIDCVAFMKTKPDKHYGLAVVDPPYGGDDAIGRTSYKKDGTREKKHKGKRKEYELFENVPPPPEYFTELIRVSKKQIIWGVNFYKDTGGVDLTGGRIVWDKKGTAFGRAELAYYSHSKAVNIIELVWNGMIQHDMKNKEVRIHPTQKPVRLYEILLDEYATPGDIILDTHRGSGSLDIACYNRGYESDSCEISPTMHEKSVKRYNQHIAQQTFNFT